MAQILSSENENVEPLPKINPFKKYLTLFQGLDFYLKAQIIVLLFLVLIVIPFIVSNRQIFTPRAEELNPEAEVTGILEVAHGDDFQNEKSTFSYNIKQDNGKKVKIKLSQSNKAKNAGARIRIKGKKIRVPKDTNVLGDSTTSAQLAQETPTPEAVANLQAASLTDPTIAIEPTTVEVIAAAPVEPTQKKVAVLLINFSNDVRTLTFADHTIVTPTAANGVVFTNANSVKNFFEEESRGAVSITGQVFGYYTIPATNANCAYDTWRSQAMTAAQNAGVDLSGYTNIVIAFPYLFNCGFAGMAYVNGPYSWNNDSFTMRIVAHELSHNFSVIHASSLNCTNSGVKVPISSSCTYAEYGDPFSIMGSSTTNHNHDEMVGELGWLHPGEVQTVTTSGTYTINPLLIAPAGNTKLLKISRGNGTYLYLDFRATFGTIYDKFVTNTPPVSGVTIRTSTDDAVPGGSTNNSMLIDTTPATTTFADAPLLVNQSFTDPIGHITVTTLSVNPGVLATVKIDMNSTVHPTPTGTNPTTTSPTPTPTIKPSPTTTPTPTITPTPNPTVITTGKISFIKHIGGTSLTKSGNSSMTIPVGGSVALGNKVIVSAVISTFSGSVTCKDNRGNIYTIDARTSANNLFICSATITKPLQLGDTITLTYPSFSGTTTALAKEFKGITSVKKFSQGSSTSTKTVTVSSAISASSDVLLFGAVGSTYTLTPLTGFSSIGSQGTLSTEYKIVNLGSYNTLGTVASGAWRSLLVGYW